MRKCLQRLEILVCPQAFDQQGTQRKEKHNRVKSKRTEGKSIFFCHLGMISSSESASAAPEVAANKADP